MITLTAKDVLPHDGTSGTLVGRVWMPDIAGPAVVGDDLSKLKPGSPEAMKLKQVLIDQNAWSQYLEVGIGPDAEVFTKAPTMSAVGTGMDAGVHPKSTWNNPEPEVVLVVSSGGG